MENYVPLFIVIVLISAGVHFFKGRKGVKTWGPFVMYSTRRGIRLIDRIANISPLFWKAFSTAGIFIGFAYMLLISITMIYNAKIFLLRPEMVQPAGMLAIPGITIPLVAGLVGIVVLAVSHEFSHGIISRVEKIKLEEVGTLSLGFIPIGAFVKPSEKQIKKSRALTKLRIFGAGSFMNIVIATLVLALVSFIIIPTFTTSIDGVGVTTVTAGTPAEEAGLTEGLIVMSVNGERTKTARDFVTVVQNADLKPGDAVKLSTATQTFEVTTADRGDGSAYMGVNLCSHAEGKAFFAGTFLIPFASIVSETCYPTAAGVNASIFWFTYSLFAWIAILNMGVGIFNLLPIKPLDGGLMIETLFKKVPGKFSVYAIRAVSLFFFAVILIGFLGPHLM